MWRPTVLRQAGGLHKAGDSKGVRGSRNLPDQVKSAIYTHGGSTHGDSDADDEDEDDGAVGSGSEDGEITGT